MNALQTAFKELRRYPSAIVSLVIILILFVVAILTPILIPYSEAVRLWRGGEAVWYRNPKLAAPTWVNFFRSSKLPETMILDSREPSDQITKEVVEEDGQRKVILRYTFEYNFDEFPQALILYYHPTYTESAPSATIAWERPDGRTLRIGRVPMEAGGSYRLSQDRDLEARLGARTVEEGLFGDREAEEPRALRGTYVLQIEANLFEPDSDLDVEFVVHGKVCGWAGTDHLRRDLGIAILWGAPVALLFGLLASLGTTVTTMIISAVGVWYGKWVDGLIQRITEVNMVLPFLPILIMVSTFYSRSIWVILGVTVLLSIFGGGIKTYRAMFLQLREAPYVEAAQAYGATNSRIIFLYLIPRIIPMLIPQLVISIPSFVYLEASLAVIGLGDPVLPTWGKVIQNATANGALYQGYYYWVLEPAILLMITGLAFAMLGFSLDRVFNPRLREL